MTNEKRILAINGLRQCLLMAIAMLEKMPSDSNEILRSNYDEAMKTFRDALTATKDFQ